MREKERVRKTAEHVWRKRGKSGEEDRQGEWEKSGKRVGEKGSN